MKTYIILLLYSLPLWLHAQNWKPFLSAEKANYNLNNHQFIDFSFWITSATSVNGDSIFQTNKVFRNDIYGQYWHEQSPFFGDTIIQKSNGIYVFLDSSHFTLLTWANLNDTWLFDTTLNIFATVIAIQADSTLGQPDSIKYISLSNNNAVIELSKNYGIRYFPNYRYNSTTASFRLVGVQNANLGKTVMTVAQIYDFNIGDVFQYLIQSNNDDFSFGYLHNIYEKREVLTKTPITNGIEYTFKIWQRDQSEQIDYFNAIHYYDTTYTYISQSTPTAYKYDSTNLASLYPASYLFSDHSFQVLDSNNTPTKYIQTLEDGIALDPAWELYGPYATFANGNTFTKYYKPYLGMIKSYNNASDFIIPINWDASQLIGYVKNGVTTGVVYSDSFYTEHILGNIDTEKELNMNCFPNPSIGKLIIDNPRAYQNVSIEIWNMNGQQLYNKSSVDTNKRIEYNLSEFPVGIYEIRISVEGKQQRQKWIKIPQN